MSASRSKLIPLALLAILVLPDPAAAQEASQEPTPEIIPSDILDKNIGGDYTPPGPISISSDKFGGSRESVGVQTQELAPISPETLGTLDESQGGLPLQMWKGTPRELLTAFLPKLPASPGARSPSGLQKRLLLSASEVPQGAPGLGEKATASLLIRRVERLYAMGDWEDGRKLLALVPEALQAEALIRYDVESLFLEHQDQQACQRAEPFLTRGEDRFWTKAAAVCGFVEDDKAHASLSLDMMREEKIADPYFFAQAESMLGLKIKKFPPLDEPRALHLTLLRLAGKPLPDGLVEKMSNPALLRAIATWSEFSGENRLLAARKAETAGALSTDELRRIYDSVEFTDKELAEAPAIDAQKAKGPRPRALLFHAAKMQAEPVSRAEFIIKGLGLSGTGNDLLSAMRLYAPLVMELPPGSQLGWFAPTALRVLLAAGEYDKAKAWSETAKPQGEGQVQNKTGEILLLPLLRLMDLSPALDLAHFENWRETQKEAPPERAATLFGLLEALGDKVPVQVWLSETDAKSEPANIPPAIWHGLKEAAQSGSSGQAALFALLALGENGPGGANPIVLQEVVRTLKAGGLEKDARALALEAAVAAGI